MKDPIETRVWVSSSYQLPGLGEIVVWQAINGASIRGRLMDSGGLIRFYEEKIDLRQSERPFYFRRDYIPRLWQPDWWRQENES